MVLNEVVRGAAGIAVATEGQGQCASQEDLKVAVESVMEEYTSLNNWHLMTVSEEPDRDGPDQQVRTAAASPPQRVIYLEIKGVVWHFGKLAF